MCKKLLSIIMVVLLLTAGLTAIGYPAPAVAGRLVIGGSTTVDVVAILLAERFMELHPGIVVETQSVGSTAGIVGTHDGRWDIGMSSRLLRGAELGWGLHEFIICYDATAPIVHPDNPVRNLTMEQLRGIFTGAIRNWAEVGGPDLRITVVIREAGSGARATFEDLVHRGIDPYARALVKPGTFGVRAAVAGIPSAIGYVTLVAVDDSVRALKVDGVAPSPETVMAGEYRLFYAFRFLTLGEPDPLERKFIDWVLGPVGQDMLEYLEMIRAVREN
jgi:phosphate transport system substrate-binding protein